jgi:hypothetical protein
MVRFGMRVLGVEFGAAEIDLDRQNGEEEDD